MIAHSISLFFTTNIVHIFVYYNKLHNTVVCRPEKFIYLKFYGTDFTPENYESFLFIFMC